MRNLACHMIYTDLCVGIGAIADIKFVVVLGCEMLLLKFAKILLSLTRHNKYLNESGI